MGVFTSFENEMLPYAAVDIARSGSAIQFRARTETGKESYRGLLSPNSITLRRVDANADQKAKPIVLLKRKELLHIFDRR